MSEQSRLVRMLESPLIHGDKKQDILDEIFKGQFCDITDSLIRIIVRKKREDTSTTSPSVTCTNTTA
ncbi:MAG: F0F1 ATP synthase subunit delta [Bacteroidia bacterium]